MIEIQTENRTNIVGYDQSSFISLSGISAYFSPITIHKIIEPEYKLEQIYESNFMTDFYQYTAHLPTKKGQLFSHGKSYYNVLKGKVSIIRNAYHNLPAFGEIVKGSKSLISSKYIFSTITDVTLFRIFLKSLFNAKLPKNTSDNDLVILNKETRQIELFPFTNKIKSLAINPNETVLLIGLHQKLVLMDI